MGNTVVIRAMGAEDLAAVLDIQACCYDAAKLESRAAFLSKLEASPATCFIAAVAEAPVGYLVAVPAEEGCPPPLNNPLYVVPRAANALYLHDLAVRPQLAGQGYGQALRQWLWSQASGWGLRWSALVSVQDTQAYWQRQGYRPQPLNDATQRQRLGSYGPGAVYMGQPLVLP